MLTLEAKPRKVEENLRTIRQTGFVPAVFYGRKEKSTPISVLQKSFIKVWKVAGESSIIALQGAAQEEKQVLIQDVSRDPVTGIPVHVDFYAIEQDKKLRVRVPIEFAGVSPAVKDLGGILVKVMHEFEIEALPKDLIPGISVDISKLVALDSQISVKDIALPTGVLAVASPEEIIAAVSVAKDEPEEPAAPIDLSSIEVEKKGKEVKEGEEGAPVAEEKK